MKVELKVDREGKLSTRIEGARGGSCLTVNEILSKANGVEGEIEITEDFYKTEIEFTGEAVNV